tara:strand:+ start:3041 stop:4333 length:1293 start_codon:yes stop_codon:yes gene_type:complete
MLSKENFARGYLILFTISIYMYWFDLLDRMAMQYFLMSILSIISFLIIPFIFKAKELKEAFLDKLSLVSLGFLLFAFLSILNATNVIESFVKIGQFIAFYISLLIIILFSRNKLVKTNFILLIISITLIIDLAASLSGYYDLYSKNIKYEYKYINNLLGLFGNRNILSVGLIFRLPFLIMLCLRLNKKFLYLITFIVASLVFFDVFLLSSRTVFLAIIIYFIFYLSVIIYRVIFLRTKFLHLNKNLILLLIIPLIIAYYSSNNLIESNDFANVNSRVSSIASSNDESKNRRLLFYGHAISNLMNNPLLGCGIGNWRILSIKYDAENMENYVVPYNAHNDILEAATETGIFGGILFLSFFLLLFYKLYEKLNINAISGYGYEFLILAPLPLIVYFVDLNLNFPSYRPFNLYLLLLYIIVLYNSNPKFNERS